MNIMTVKIPQGLEYIDAIMGGYKSYQVLKAALDLKLFDWLEDQGTSNRDEIASGLGINGMFIRSFLQSLVDMKMVLKEGDKYSNSPIASSFLVSSSLCYQGDWLKNTGRQNSKWSHLTDTLTTKETSMPDFAVGPGEDFIRALAQRALRGELQAVTKEITSWEGFSQARSLIDIGGGHGLYAIALCQVNQLLEGVVFDKPHVIEFAEDYIKHYKMSNRIRTQGGDAMKDDLGRGFDIVIISHLLYKFRKQLPEFFKKLSNIVNPGGILVSNHWFCSPGCCSVQDGVQELDQAIQSSGHPLCHIDEFNTLFAKNGFAMKHTTEVPSITGPCKLHIAVKIS